MPRDAGLDRVFAVSQNGVGAKDALTSALGRLADMCRIGVTKPTLRY